MFKSPRLQSQSDRLSQLICSQRSQEDPPQPTPSYSPQYDQDSHTLSQNQDVIIFSQHNNTHTDSPSQIQFSQSFTRSYRFPGTESVRDREYSRSPNRTSSSVDKLEKQIASKDHQLMVKEQQIRQLTDFLNKKKKEEGNVNTIFSQEFNKVQEDLAKKEILNGELMKKVGVLEEELRKYKELNDENYEELMKLNKDNERLEAFMKEADGVVDQMHKALQEKQQENRKLKEANRKMAEVLGDNVGGDWKIGNKRENKYDMSPRGSAVSPLSTPTNIALSTNTQTIKHKQEINKLQQQLQTLTIKYDEMKKKVIQKDKLLVELKEQTFKLETSLQSNQKQIESLMKSLNEKNQQIRNGKEKEERIGEMQKRIKGMKQESEKKEMKITAQISQLAEKNKTILDKIKIEGDLKSKLELERHKNKEGVKEIDVLNEKLRSGKEVVGRLEKEVEYLKGNQVQYKKDQGMLREVEKEREMYKMEANKNIEKYQKEITEKDQLIIQIKKKLQQSQKKHISQKSKSTSSQTQISQLLSDLTSQKQKSKKQSIQITKKQSQAERLQNKIMLLEARVSKTSYLAQSEANEELEDRICSLELILEKKNQIIERLQGELEQLHANQIDKQISHDLINYNLKQAQENGSEDRDIIQHLKQQLQEKYQTIMILKKDNELKDKSIQFAMERFLKAEHEKLVMEGKLRSAGVRYDEMEDSTLEGNDEDEEGINMEQEYDKLLNRCETLEQRNKDLEQQLWSFKDCKSNNIDSSKTKSTTTTTNKLEVIKLRNENEELRDELNRVVSERRGSNMDRLGSGELVELLVEILERVYRSSELVKMVLRNGEFLELIKRITRREDRDKERDKGQVLLSKKSY